MSALLDQDGPKVRLADPLRLQGLTASREIEEDTKITYLARIVNPKPGGHCKCLFPEFVGFGQPKQMFRDQPIRRKHVDIWIKRPRWRCKRCNCIVQAKVPGMASGHQMTARLADDVFKSSFKRTFSDVAREVGLSEGSVRNVFNGRVDAALAAQGWVTPRVLGIDEKKMMGDYRCVLGDVEERCLFDLVSNRRKKTLFEYLPTMKDKERVEIVCMDMWPTYREAVRTFFPKARIVTDKFHVVRMANDAIEAIRKEIRRGLDREQRLKMRDERFTLLRRQHNWTDKDRARFAYWGTEFPELVEVFYVKERFFDIFDRSQSATEARRAYFVWNDGIPDAYRKLFKPITTAMTNWGGSAFACCDPDYRFTSAYIEALNGFLGKIDQDGRSYGFDVFRGKALLAFGRAKAGQQKFERLKPGDTMEIDGETVSIKSIRWHLGPEPEETGMPISTLAGLLVDGRFDLESTSFYE